MQKGAKMGLFDKVVSKLSAKYNVAPPQNEESPFRGDFKKYENLPQGEKATITHSGKYQDSIATREWCSLKAPAECGFDFSNVILQENTGVDKETGEIIGEQTIVLLQDENLKKFVSDMMEMMELNQTIKAVAPTWPASEATWLFGMLYEAVDGRIEVPGFDKVGTIRVMPLTPTGKVKKYPLGATVVLDVRDEVDLNKMEGLIAADYTHTIICQGSYLASGEIGRATITIHGSRKGHGACIERAKDGELFIKFVTRSEFIMEDGRLSPLPLGENIYTMTQRGEANSSYCTRWPIVIFCIDFKHMGLLSLVRGNARRLLQQLGWAFNCFEFSLCSRVPSPSFAS